MANFTVIYDACVFYPAPLRDFLMHLALTELFRARWTETIHEEWIVSVLANRPDLTRAQLERTRDFMNKAIPDCLVTGYRELIPGLTLPDPNDRHVLAAAIRAGAGAIVTFNLKDFPPEALQSYGVEAQHPDEFVMDLLDLDHRKVCAAARNQRHNLKKPAQTLGEYLANLERQQLTQTRSRLQSYVDLL
jgi:PIN domain